MEELLNLIENQPNNINARLQLVQKYLDNQDINNAGNELKEILSIDDNNFDANYILGQIYEYNEEFSRAAECFEKVVKQQPKPELKYRLAQLYENADEYEKALVLFKECSQSSPDDPDICERIAHVSRILGNNSEAIESYNRILKKDPENIVALTGLMDFYEEEDKLLYYTTKAKIHILEGTPTHAVSAYKKALAEAEHIDDINQIRYALAEIFVQNENYLQAIDQYLVILENDSKNYKVLKNLAQAYSQLDNMESAAEAYEKALEIYPDNKEVLMELADIFIEINEFNKAESILETLIKTEPKNHAHQINLARVYIAVHKDAEAKEKLNFVIQKDPKNMEALSILVDFYILNKDYGQALKHIEEIKKSIPNSPFGYKKAGEVYEILKKAYDSHCNYALYHDIKGEKQLAIDEFTWALEHDPNNTEIILKVARLYEEISESYLALEYYQRAFKADNRNIFALEKMGEIHTKNKNFEYAADIYKEIINIDPREKEACFNLASSYEQVKNYDLALENYKKYLELSPNALKSDEAKSRIDKIEKKMYGEEDEGLLEKIFRFFSR